MPRPSFRGFRGAFLRQKREERGWTQESLAVQAGVFPTRVGKWERGEAAPEVENVARLAEVLEVPPQRFTDVPVEEGTLVDLRVWAGLTRSEAARRAAMSTRRLLAFEHVTARPDEAAAETLAGLYGVPAEALLAAWDREREALYPGVQR